MTSSHDLSHTFGIKGGDFGKAGCVSLEIKEILHELGIDPAIVRRVAIAAYEAEMNVVMYADKGKVVLRLNPKTIRITLEDEGPGIEDRMREMGFGAGMGLPNIKKNADRFELQSQVGKGTSYDIVIHLNPEGEK
jgi:serine/threonine-protein kinase RsbT